MATLTESVRVSHTPGARRKVLAAAMARTGAGSLVSGLLSIAATKIVASVLGPAGVALLATLQQTRQTALVAATANGQAALVQGISARGGIERREYVRTAALTFGAASAAVLALMCLAPAWAASLTGLGAGRATLIGWVAIQVALLSAYVFLSGLVNALGGLGRLAALQSIAPAVTAAGMFPVVLAMAGGREVLLPMLLAGAAGASVLCAGVVLRGYRHELSSWFRGTGRWWSGASARAFFRVSASMLLGGLAGSAAVLFVRTRIIEAQGFSTAGQFDAAWGISMNQVMLLLTSMQAYYLPSVARARTAAERSAQISTVLNLAALIAAPLLVIATAMKPLLLGLFYSREFGEASAYLRWMLIGDYLKVAGWILSVPLLANADMGMYLAAELTGYLVFAGATLVLVRWRPAAESAAIGFLAMNAAHAIFCAVRAGSRYRYRPERRTVSLWLAGLAAVCAAGWSHWEIRPFQGSTEMFWSLGALAAAGCAARGLTHLERKTS